ncbi:MAG: phosphopantothenoylcysteine decarboxylase [Prosthecobacter sp.]|nr:phosphopantothenoylcysteine decarboxylase [Prosthecobacter sp.]
MRVLITAGPTREAIDPVRFLSNRSSGRMGYALAEAAREAGHEVVLISGPVSLAAPDGVTVKRVETAQEMLTAVAEQIGGVDIGIFAAAVADYRPAVVAGQKLKKGGERLTLELERTVDILGTARGVMGFSGYLVGFAAETENLVAQAREKLTRKGCDLVIANDVAREGIGFDSVENEVTLCLPGGETLPLPRQSKAALARELMTIITQRAAAQLKPPL